METPSTGDIAVEWSRMLEEAKDLCDQADKIVTDYGQPPQKNRLRALLNKLQRVIDTGKPDLVRQVIEGIYTLFYEVLESVDAFHVCKFQWLEDRRYEIPDRDQNQAKHLIAQGHRAIYNEDIQTLKETNRQLSILFAGDRIRRKMHGLSDMLNF